MNINSEYKPITNPYLTVMNSLDKPELSSPAQEPVFIHIPKYDIIREVVAPILSSQDKPDIKSLSPIIQSLIRNSNRMTRAENSYDDLCHIYTAFTPYFNENKLLVFEDFLAKRCIDHVKAKIAQKNAIRCFFYEEDKENVQQYTAIVGSVVSEALSKKELTQNKTLKSKLSKIKERTINEFKTTICSTSQSRKTSRKINSSSKYKEY